MITTNIPQRNIGPIKINSAVITTDVYVPMATYETPLWPSTSRGARATAKAGGINAIVVSECMTRSAIFDANSATIAASIVASFEFHRDKFKEIVEDSSKFAKFIDFTTEIVGSLIYFRLSIYSCDASGHNMVTLCMDKIQSYILQEFSNLQYVSISGNYCTDKKVSAVNGILGRGRRVVADIVISEEICRTILKTTPEKIVDLHVKKNLLGGCIAGSLRTANAHFANMLLAIYLATGQDAANIIEASQGIVHAEVRGNNLYFSVTLPNLIVGTIGSGKHLDHCIENLKTMGCYNLGEPGLASQKFAVITAAAVMCGELSLLAAQTNQGELMRSHTKIERSRNLVTDC